MPPRVMPGPVQNDATIREAVCVHTNKICDSCRDKDCLEDLLVYPTVTSQPIIDGAMSIRPRSAELLYVTIDVEDVAFNRGFYTVDLRYFYKIRGDAYALVNIASEISGLAIFNKRVILYGSEGNAKIYSSETKLDALDIQSTSRANLPHAVVEAVDPIMLDLKMADPDGTPAVEPEPIEVPDFISSAFNGELVFNPTGRRLYATLGQFSIIRLERDSQLLIPSYDYCMPDKECVGTYDNDPCTLFSRIEFPVDEFFPPDSLFTEEQREVPVI